MWEQLMKNQVLVSSVTGWVVAQLLKTIIDCMLNKSFSPERLVGSGGMPSSHSSYGMRAGGFLRPLFWGFFL